MRRILFMSNDPIFRKKNAETLSENGFEVIEVSGALDGLLRVDKNGHAAIIIDEELSDIDGYRTCPKIRQYSKIPIILLGSESADEVWAKADDMGFDIYLKKPISPRELAAHVNVLLKRMPSYQKEEEQKRPGAQEEKVVSMPIPTPIPISSEPAMSVRTQTPIPPPQTSPTATSPNSASANEAVAVPDRYDEKSASIKQRIPSASEPELPRQEIKIEREPAIRPPLSDRMSAPIWLDRPVGKDIPTPTIPMEAQPARIGKENLSPSFSVKAAPEPSLVQMTIQKEKTPDKESYDLRFTTSEKESKSFQKTSDIPREKTMFKVWQDAHVAKLLDALISNKITQIVPTIDPSTKNGFSYPNEDALMETPSERTTVILEKLADDDILLKKPLEKLHIDPDNSFQLLPVERCPRCDSSNLIKGQLIEHFYCGYVGLEQDFVNGYKYICPKCKRELKLLGTDYRNAGQQYKCLDCNNIFPSPVIKWRSFKTGKVWSESDLRDFWLHSYALNPDKREWLEFQLKPKGQLVEFLQKQGYQVQELAQIHGNSGAIHTIDILATRDDGVAKYHVGVGILSALPGEEEVRLEELFKFDTRAYDMGINYKVVIAIPKLGQEAIKFAERQNIGIFEANDLEALISFLNNKAHPSPSGQISDKVRSLADREGTDTQTLLASYLRERGYEVFEKARISGKSGAEHDFDIYARRDDVIVRPTIAVDIITADPGQMVGIDKIAQFDAEAYDVGIRNKVAIGHPQINAQAKQFAKQQRIRAFDIYELKSLLITLIK